MKSLTASKLSVLATVALGLLPLAACSSHITQVQQNNGLATRSVTMLDRRSDDELAKILPADALSQKEFPKSYVLSMTRVCVSQNQGKSLVNPIAQAGKADEFCGCLIEKRVHRFTMADYIEGEKGRWDAKTMPELSHKNNAILAECAQQVLK